MPGHKAEHRVHSAAALEPPDQPLALRQSERQLQDSCRTCEHWCGSHHGSHHAFRVIQDVRCRSKLGDGLRQVCCWHQKGAGPLRACSRQPSASKHDCTVLSLLASIQQHSLMPPGLHSGITAQQHLTPEEIFCACGQPVTCQDICFVRSQVRHRLNPNIAVGAKAHASGA